MTIKPRSSETTKLDRELDIKVTLWRLRGKAARQSKQPRAMPRLQRSTRPEFIPPITAAWFAGYDGR